MASLRFGVHTAAPTHATATATTTTGAMLAANHARGYALIQNLGSSVVYLKVGANAVASEGIALPQYASYEMSERLGNLFQGAINGITASGSSVVSTLEVTL